MEKIHSSSIKNMLEMNIHEFIIEAYRVILGRQPDIEAYKCMIEAYIKGKSKVEMLKDIAFSEEAKSRDVELEYKWDDTDSRKLFDSLCKNNEKKRMEEALIGVSEMALELHEENQNLKQRVAECLQKIDSNILEQKKIEENSDREFMLVEMSKLRAEMMYLRHSISETNTISSGEKEDNKNFDISNENVYEAIDYFDFENHFRGSREHIKEVQKIYLQYFAGCKKVLDLGCGRGEFTELLNENNIGVTGVDMYAPYVEYMKLKRLPVLLGDAISYLKEQDYVDGIFLGQVIEHISIDQIIDLCRTAFDKLEKGRYLIMETPNPTSLAIFTNAFYMDPSHNKPVHPMTLKYLVERAGFSEVEIVYTESSKLPYEIPEICKENKDFESFNNSMKALSNLLYGSQDYAIIARK